MDNCQSLTIGLLLMMWTLDDSQKQMLLCTWGLKTSSNPLLVSEAELASHGPCGLPSASLLQVILMTFHVTVT